MEKREILSQLESIIDASRVGILATTDDHGRPANLAFLGYGLERGTTSLGYVASRQ